jgi:hypothetical protein
MPERAILSVQSMRGEVEALNGGSGLTDGRPLLQGIAPPNSFVAIWANGQYLTGVYADGQGNWGYRISLKDGDYSLVVKNGSRSSEAVNVTVSKEAYKVAILSVFDDDGAMGLVRNYEQTDDATPLISGTATAGSLVTIYSNGNIEGTVTADSRGYWNYRPQLNDGINVLTVAADGITSATYTIDVQPSLGIKPHYEIDKVWADEGQIGAIENGGMTNDRTPLVSGVQVPPLTPVQLWINGEFMLSDYSNFSGEWSFNPVLAPGLNTIEIVVMGERSAAFEVVYTENSTESFSLMSLQYDQLLSDESSLLFAQDIQFDEQTWVLTIDESHMHIDTLMSGQKSDQNVTSVSENKGITEFEEQFNYQY